MNGFNGKILYVNLSEKNYRIDQPPAEIYQKWIGGKGLAGFLLAPHITRDWQDPAMPIILMAGPLVGTLSPTSGRMCIMSRSPLTGTVGDCSVGGRLGTELKKAGLDGIVISGESREWCGIEIQDEKITFCSANARHGQGNAALYPQLKAKGSVVTIGPAAENGVLFSNLMVDGSYAAGRNGLGAIFAAKKLKYLTLNGSGKVRVADRSNLLKAREDIFRLAAASPVLMGKHGLTHYGTGALYDLMDSRRMMPTANFQQTHFEDAAKMNAVAYRKKYDTHSTGCKGCHIRCKKVGKNGTHIPEFETMSHFSALLQNADLETVARANAICNAAGMDTISAASTLACYAELQNKKLSGPAVLELLDAIAHGRGVGRELGPGSYRYAATNGRPELSFSVKKLELPAYDPRGAYGMALAYATATRGGCHLRAYPISHEILRKPVATDRFSFAGKARIIKIAEDLNAIVDSLTACKFIFFASSLEEYARVFTAVTGIQMAAQDLLEVGERIYYHERILNARNGFTSKDDDLPPRFFTEPGSSGNEIEITPLNREEFLETRANYYKVRGLTPDGRPVRERAEALGLELR